MFSIFKKKRNVESLISDHIPISDFVDGVLVFKDYYISRFQAVSNPAITKLSDNELCLSIMANLREDQCALMYCGNVSSDDLGLVRSPILFFDTYIFAGISFDTNILYCLLNPIVENLGLATMEGIDASMKITSLIIAMKNDKNSDQIKNLLYRDTELIIRKLAEIKQ